MPERPNVVLIMTDQHHPEALGVGDRPVTTPNIDALANDGVRFDSAYCPSPICGPARAAIFSGQYPRTTGITGNWSPIDNDIQLLPTLLRDAGYHTGIVGKLHILPHAAPHGFEHDRRHDAMNEVWYAEEPWQSSYVEWLADKRFGGDVTEVIERATEDELLRHGDRQTNTRKFLLGSNWRSEEEHSNTWIANESIRYLDDHREDPFFLFASFYGPHHPFAVPGRWDDLYDPDEIDLPPEFSVSTDGKPIAQQGTGVSPPGNAWDEDQYREVLAAYYGQVSMIDHNIGRILDALDRLHLSEDTLVIFTADHGDHAGQFRSFTKGTMYHGSVGVPLVVRDPSRPQIAGTTSSRVLNNLDLFETILEHCRVDHDEQTASRSFVPLLEDPDTDDWVDETYAEFRDATSMFVEGDYKLIHDRESNYQELYDRTNRPRDSENLWERAEFEHVQSRLVDRLEQVEDDIDSGQFDAFGC